MSNLIFTFLTLICYFCHLPLRTSIRRGRVRESFCTGWCIDLLFSVCGVVAGFQIYHYDILPVMTWKHLLPFLTYLLLTVLFFFLAPSGLRLLRVRRPSADTLLAAEYRLHDTLIMVRGFLMLLLFGLPIVLRFLFHSGQLSVLLTGFNENQLCGGFCFICFLLLLPVSLRQSFFWLQHLQQEPEEQETYLLRQYSIRLHYRKRNYHL